MDFFCDVIVFNMNDVKNVAEIHPIEPTEQSTVTPLG